MSCIFFWGKYVSEDFLNECPERLNVNSLVSMPDLPAQLKQEPNSKLEYLERGPYGFEHRIPFTILWFITISPEKKWPCSGKSWSWDQHSQFHQAIEFQSNLVGCLLICIPDARSIISPYLHDIPVDIIWVVDQYLEKLCQLCLYHIIHILLTYYSHCISCFIRIYNPLRSDSKNTAGWWFGK